MTRARQTVRERLGALRAWRACALNARATFRVPAPVQCTALVRLHERRFRQMPRVAKSGPLACAKSVLHTREWRASDGKPARCAHHDGRDLGQVR
eukprot:3726882-Pleurochrysis_carterae.AAC.4